MESNKRTKDLHHVFETHYQAIYAYVRSIVGASLAEDICQETFIKAFQARKRFAFRSESQTKSWLFRIARNTCLDMIKKDQKVTFMGQEHDLFLESFPAKAEAQNDPFVNQELDRALNGLESEEREIISLRYYSELQVKEIAKVLKLKPNTVSVKIKRALEKLEQTITYEI